MLDAADRIIFPTGCRISEAVKRTGGPAVTMQNVEICDSKIFCRYSRVVAVSEGHTQIEEAINILTSLLWSS